MFYFVGLLKFFTLNFRAAKDKEITDCQMLLMEEREKSETFDCFCGSYFNFS